MGDEKKVELSRGGRGMTGGGTSSGFSAISGGQNTLASDQLGQLLSGRGPCKMEALKYDIKYRQNNYR